MIRVSHPLFFLNQNLKFYSNRKKPASDQSPHPTNVAPKPSAKLFSFHLEIIYETSPSSSAPLPTPKKHKPSFRFSSLVVTNAMSSPVAISPTGRQFVLSKHFTSCPPPPSPHSSTAGKMLTRQGRHLMV